MTNILTAAEAANFLRTNTSDAVMLMLLPQVDDFILRATGRDWTADTSINQVAKNAAGMLLVQWYDNPSGSGETTLSLAVIAALGQLEAEALKYRKYQFYGANGAGGIAVNGAKVGDTVEQLTGIYGVSGDQSAKFENTISVCGQIQQTNSADLSDNIYVAILKSPADDVHA